MKRRFSSSPACLGLVLSLLLTGSFPTWLLPKALAQQNAPQPATLKPSARNIGGAFELPAETLLYGDVNIYLPDDMAAGDTISGTVVAEPKGSNDEERARNRDTLEGLVIDLGDQKIPVSKGAFKWVVPTISRPIRVVELTSGRELAKRELPVNAPLPMSRTSVTPAPGSFQLPTVGQQGRAVEIQGPFDGDFSNTSVNWKATHDLQRDTGSPSGGFGLIAESPRKAIFRSPRDVTGPVEINLNEGNVEAKGIYRNIGVRLSAPKTNLLKGEKTTVTINVIGLQGIQQTIPLLLVKGGVVDMEGGDVQLIPITASGLRSGGAFIATRAITGQQTGAFTVTATVIARRFDVCIRDDRVPTTAVLWNTFTGDYIFTQAGGARGKGTGKVTIKGCIITLTDKAPDRKVMSTVNQCSNTGDASVEGSSPNVRFSIADRNTTDNSCSAAP